MKRTLSLLLMLAIGTVGALAAGHSLGAFAGFLTAALIGWDVYMAFFYEPARERRHG